MASRLLNTVQTSERLGDIPVATLRWWRHVGLGPKSFKVGRRVMYREEDVETWLDEQYEAANAESK